MPSLLASPEEKRAHQLRRFESWFQDRVNILSVSKRETQCPSG